MRQGTGLYTMEDRVQKAVELHEEGFYPEEIALIMGVRERSVYRYLKKGGCEMHPGRYPYVTNSELEKTQQKLSEHNGDRQLVARDLGLSSANAIKYREVLIETRNLN